jgi:hypothetical protein
MGDAAEDFRLLRLESKRLSAMLGFPPVLDACCGSRMFWFDKQDERAKRSAPCWHCCANKDQSSDGSEAQCWRT